ncbi:hypothetical protein LEP1GSC059_0802 [Leptospira noguchii serovar Panama str. CZ214]|uniref:Uncharacterized protein n=1 Tax=Leptospira noguchii serovar Panama str. CZ214 TaxID=1001595 RepID=T0FNK5_9LEPT|nr:hypothetical protein LEP1GSC059_0802 [Leptospira noguchii serovar Panama str. CZ214]
MSKTQKHSNTFSNMKIPVIDSNVQKPIRFKQFFLDFYLKTEFFPKGKSNF